MKKITKATVRPTRSLNLLSHREVAGVMETDESVFRIFRDCALAVLNTGSESDEVAQILEEYADFEVRVVSESRGIKLEVYNAPASAFVDGRMIRGIQEHLFAALRDIVYTEHKINRGGRFDFSTSGGLTDAVFRILRNAGVVQANRSPNLVVCWGGHSIDRLEYDYSKEVGYQLGLRALDVATGCGIGAMKGPMKGALIGHSKQQIRDGRYVGLTEPGIIASESPNPTVNELVILPDIEKRLEAFVRLAHCIIVFPGGAGTAEEVLYLLGILMHPDNQDIPLPVIFAAPEGREEYFQTLDQFIRSTLGERAADYYQIVIGDPERVARLARASIERVVRHRRQTQESYAFNWNCFVPEEMQYPFHPTHENMAALQLDSSLPTHVLAAQLRRAFSGIVAGNVKAFGIQQVRERGPYQLRGEHRIMGELDCLLKEFVQQGRMKLKEEDYQPCFELVT
ncbi:nucleotide 5'-monophosphate nucleosidase PpnN [Gilvimarinus sp. F26214L]|uniref:nucleotide 5'-monophosphate nucleosidase PpnN n=1 Tax=Gilvimarinus sp. DZF01 TaxID=3461371 RepID=UPI0040461BCC